MIFDFNDQLDFNLINYTKPKNTIANLYLEAEKIKNTTKINKLNYKEDNNLIQIDDLIFKKKDFISFKNIKIATKNNDFFIKKNEKIFIKGKKFDATNLAKFFGEETDDNKFKNINEKIEIDFSNIKIPMSEKLQNFKLLGEIKRGKFVKISSKGEFGNNNFLDISMKKDKNSDRKYLEIYSDLTRPLLTEYNFFRGLSVWKVAFHVYHREFNNYFKSEN